MPSWLQFPCFTIKWFVTRLYMVKSVPNFTYLQQEVCLLYTWCIFFAKLEKSWKITRTSYRAAIFQHIHWIIINVFIWDFVSSAFALYLVRLTFLFNKYHWVHQLCLLSLHLGPSSSWPCRTSVTERTDKNMDPADELGEVIYTLQCLVNYCCNTFNIEHREAAPKWQWKFPSGKRRVANREKREASRWATLVVGLQEWRQGL